MVKCLWFLALAASAAAGQCDSIDFNNDGLFPDTQDRDDFVSVFGGGPCSTGDCNDIDFNNDGIFPDTEDLAAFVRVFSGGKCRDAEGGWTELQGLPAGARVIYLSSAGSESNSGDDAQHPLRRWPTAWSRVRDGFGDRICIVGDLTLDEVNGASMYSKSSVTVYGDMPGRRPVIRRVGEGNALYVSGGGYITGLTFVGLDFQSGDVRASSGFAAYATGGDWLIEDCSFSGFQLGMSMIGGPLDGITVRRCQFFNNAPLNGHSQGAYLEQCRNVLIDECVFDKNGRRPNGDGTIFNHNLYVHSTCDGIEVRNSISSRASATGLQLRFNHQDAIGNLVIDCPLGITLGHDDQLANYPAKFVYGSVVGNFIVGTSDIAPTAPRRGPAVGFGLAKNVTISGNYIIDAPNAAYGAIRSDRPSTNVRVIGNYSNWPTPVMQWGGTASSAEPTNMVDVDQEPRAIPAIEDYLHHYKIVPATKERFIELARANRKGAWDERWTAQGYIQWAKTN